MSEGERGGEEGMGEEVKESMNERGRTRVRDERVRRCVNACARVRVSEDHEPLVSGSLCV